MSSQGFSYGTWPADINGDGKTDLIGATVSDGWPGVWDLGVAIGKGDGTFLPSRSLGLQAMPIGSGDFNGDGKIDVVISGVAILPGRGDGTFDAPRAITGAPAPPLLEVVVQDALSADFDGDVRRDLVLASDGTLDVYRGHGDFTFDPPVSLPAGATAGNGIVGDFNGDGRRDIAFVEPFDALDLFINRGGMLFEARTITLPGRHWAITTGDLNRDAKADLIVTSTDERVLDWPEGQFDVLLGNGDGTFQPEVRHSTGAAGSVTTVVGDFNRDGLLDVATGNRSWIYVDNMCGPVWHLWDSVTIMPGLGNGSFGDPATFRLSSAPYAYPGEASYADTHNALKTSDVNGDKRTDLIASNRAVLLTVAASTNRVPVIAASATMIDSTGFRLSVALNEPDSDWLSFEWRDRSGRLISRAMEFCYEASEDTTLSVTVTDARGGTSTDSVTIRHEAPAGLPAEWSSADIGAVSAPGATTYDGNAFTLRGSGADVWGTADELHYAWRPAGDHFTFTARLVNVDRIDRWTKAGLMIRSTTDARSAHASLFATPSSEKGLAFQRRRSTAGASFHTPGPALAPSVWLRLVRDGNLVSAYSRTSSSEPWRLIGTDTLSGTAVVGLAVSSHVDGTLATAVFDNVTLE